MKELSCFEYADDESGNSSTTNVWPSTTSDAGVSKESITTEDITTTDQDTAQLGESTTSTNDMTLNNQINNFQNKLTQLPNKNINLNIINNNNLQSNDIRKVLSEDDLYLTDKIDKQIEDENMKHKLLHEEFARRGNFETVFSQPQDHFVPPLVMAKAKLSDDMIVLSLEEKHAQQLAEQRLSIQKSKSRDNNIVTSKNIESIKPSEESTRSYVTHSMNNNISTEDATTTLPLSILNINNITKVTKNSVPKKYNTKNDDLKTKSGTSGESFNKKYIGKFSELDLNKNSSTLTNLEFTTVNIQSENINEDPSIELKVIISEPEQKLNSVADSSYKTISTIDKIPETTQSSHSVTNVTEEITTINIIRDKIINTENGLKITTKHMETPKAMTNAFEFTTKIPVISHEDSTVGVYSNRPEIHLQPVEKSTMTVVPIIPSVNTITSKSYVNNKVTEIKSSNLPEIILHTITTPASTHLKENNDNNTTLESSTSVYTENITIATDIHIEADTSFQNTSVKSILQQNVTDTNESSEQDILKEYNGYENHTDIYVTATLETEETIDDFQSPLLSGASDPLPKPNRMRRPQTSSNRNKFNPFRILG